MRHSRLIAAAALLVLCALWPLVAARAATGSSIAIADVWLRMQWEPAAGPVQGYVIFVSRDGREPHAEQYTLEPYTLLLGSFGQEIAIQVAAYDSQGEIGPLSPPSVRFRLVPPDEDPDGDGWISRADVCPLHFDPLQHDGDLDGVGDACDRCVVVADAGQGDVDDDGIGDVCECGDANGDGWVDALDARTVQLCSVRAIDTPGLCSGACDVTGDGECSTLDARMISLLVSGQVSKTDLSCALRP